MKGKVYLIGAGPGDYGLMTLKGMDIIRNADVIYYDRLVNSSYLKESKKGCELIYVGKESSNHTLPQDEINKELAYKAKEGKVVARLKGGDPYVFGRGGEEGEILYDEGIEFEVVPGITSAIAGLCYAGIPITHRDYSSSFHIITGHLKDLDKSLDWDNISSMEGTLVFLMGVSNLKNIATNLIARGKAANTAAAIINWATTSKQRVIVGTLENIYEKAVLGKIQSPSLIVVGDVVGLREKLNFFEKKELFGKNIVVTRSREQNSSLVEKIRELGGNAIEIPSIKIKKIQNNLELKKSIEKIDSYNYIIFTSTNGVDIFFQELFEQKRDSRSLSSTKIVAIGSATADELLKYGIIADILPEKYIGEKIVEKLKEIVKDTDNILIPRASAARKYLVEELSSICNVTEVKIYDTVIDNSERDTLLELIQNEDIDYITFASSSTVENFISLLGNENISRLKNIKLISIGPITSAALAKNGLEAYEEAKEYTIEGIIKCLGI